MHIIGKSLVRLSLAQEPLLTWTKPARRSTTSYGRWGSERGQWGLQPLAIKLFNFSHSLPKLCTRQADTWHISWFAKSARCGAGIRYQVQCRRGAYRANHTSASWDHLLGGAITKLFFPPPSLPRTHGYDAGACSKWHQWHQWHLSQLAHSYAAVAASKKRKADHLDDVPSAFRAGVFLAEWSHKGCALCLGAKQAKQRSIKRYLASSCRSGTSQSPSSSRLFSRRRSWCSKTVMIP